MRSRSNQASDPNTGVGGDALADYSKAFGAGESVSGAADTWNQPLRGNWNQLKQLKAKHPGLKVLISLGGWTWSRGFSNAARPENRQAFVASCIDAYIRGWKYDGDTFWSYDTPAMITEKMSYVKVQNLGGAFFWEFSGDDSQAGWRLRSAMA